MMSLKQTGILLALLVAGAAPAWAQTATYQDPKAPVEARVNDLFSKLTRDEKLSLLTGTGFSTNPIPRLGGPAVEGGCRTV